MIEIIEVKNIENQEQFLALDSIYQEFNNRYKSGHVSDTYIEEITYRFNNEYEKIVNDRRSKGAYPLYPKALTRLTVEFSKLIYGSKMKLGTAM